MGQLETLDYCQRRACQPKAWAAASAPLTRTRKVRLLVAGPDVRIITEDGELIRALTRDPTRSYQPLGGRWPVHNVLQQVSSMS